MPFGPIDEKGTVLYYEDSGVPAGSRDYVTIVLVHGTMIHSATFRGMVPYAAEHNLRLVLVNLRDYKGSTLYSPEELDALASPVREVQARAIEARGLELATFLRWYIETEHIPPISETPDANGRLTGGVAVFGWSGGNYQTIPLVGSFRSLPEDTRKLLDGYFRALFIYDMSQTAMGIPPVEGLYSPFRDRSLTGEQMMEAFPKWITSYYTQAIVDGSQDCESPGFLSMLRSRKPVHEDNQNGDPRFTPTLLRISSEELAETIDYDVFLRSQIFYPRIALGIYAEQFRSALFDCYLDDESGEERMVWPRLKVHVLWCDMSFSDGVYAAHKVRDMVAQSRKYGRGRHVQVHRIEQANHFVHWEEPERFIKVLADVM